MANAFTTSTIANAVPYYYERIPYTAQVTNLTGGGSAPLFNPVLGWNGPTSPSTLVTVASVGLTGWNQVELRATYDGNSDRLHTRTFPPNLQGVPTRYRAVNSLTAQLVNTSTATAPTLDVRYTMEIWQMSIAYKLMAGYALSTEESDIAQAMGLPTNPELFRGDLPMPIATILDREWGARQVLTPMVVAQAVTATASQSPVAHVRAQPNQVLVLRSVACEAAPEDQVVLSIDRDNNPGHVQITGSPGQLARPLDCYVPALSHFTINIQAASALNYPVPIRLEVWQIALSLILRIRLGLLTAAAVTKLLGSEQGNLLLNQLAVGVY